MCMFMSAAETVGGDPDEDVKGPLSAAVGAPGDHDECGGSDSTWCGEGYSKGHGPVRQQHHLCPLPVPEPKGERCT